MATLSPLLQYPLRELFALLSPECLVQLLSCVLLESQVLLVAAGEVQVLLVASGEVQVFLRIEICLLPRVRLQLIGLFCLLPWVRLHLVGKPCC